MAPPAEPTQSVWRSVSSKLEVFEKKTKAPIEQNDEKDFDQMSWISSESLLKPHDPEKGAASSSGADTPPTPRLRHVLTKSGTRFAQECLHAARAICHQRGMEASTPADREMLDELESRLEVLADVFEFWRGENRTQVYGLGPLDTFNLWGRTKVERCFLRWCFKVFFMLDANAVMRRCKKQTPDELAWPASKEFSVRFWLEQLVENLRDLYDLTDNIKELAEIHEGEVKMSWIRSIH